MANLKCGFCQGTSFALSTEQPAGARFPLCIVRCASCDAPVGVLQNENAADVMRVVGQDLADRLRQTEDRITKALAEVRDRLPSP